MLTHSSMKSVEENRKLFLIASFLFLLSINYLVYFVPRENFWISYGLIGVSFVTFYFCYKHNSNIIQIIVLGVIVRLSLLLATPELSDDFYRFLWDGAVTNSGHSPFLYKPVEVLEKGWLVSDYLEHFSDLNSPNYYTVYPSFIQLIDWLSVRLGSDFFGAMVFMKVSFFLAELASLFYLYKLLEERGKTKLIGLFWLFPLVIIEFVGNLHFECFMITFLLGAVYYLKKNKLLLSAIFFALAFHTKLIPLIFFPFFFFNIEGKKKWLFTLYVMFFVGLGLLPFAFDDAFLKLMESVGLYFGNFEFNSLLGIFSIKSKIVSISFKVLSVLLLGGWIYYTLLKKHHPLFSIAVMYFIYLIFSQSVHPWYVIPLLPFFLIEKVPRTLWVWLILLPLTYITYINTPYEQKTWVRFVEYLGVLVVFSYEFYEYISEIRNLRRD